MTRYIYKVLSKIIHLSYCFVNKFYKTKGTIYMLHNISDETNEFSITQHQLDSFLKGQNKSKVIHLLDWPDKTDFVAFTIDDVPENFYHNGFPVFKKYGIPFTIFVNTSLLDQPGYITIGQLKEMAKCELCTVGSHGTVHKFYKGLQHEDKIRFLGDSNSILSKICGCQIELFAFPYGSVYACGLKDIRLVSDFYKFGFGTIASNITEFSKCNRNFLPRKNLKLQS